MSANPNPNSSPKLADSVENIDDLEKVFNRFDANGDGKISASEFGDILRALGSDSSEEEIKRMMMEIDSDGDGFIDLKEFTEFHRGGLNGDSNGDGGIEALKDAFEMYDKDKNGFISAKELHMVLKSLGEKCSINDCSRMISSVDADGDGRVNFEEFKKMMTNGST